MPNTTNKVKFGLKNVHYAPITSIADDGTVTYGTVGEIKGAVNLSMDPNGGIDIFFADNGAYYQQNNSSGFTGTLEVALVPKEFKTACLGAKTDSNGVLFDDDNAVITPFALMFEFDGDKHKTRHILYNCTATKTAVSSATTTQTKDVQTETLNLNAVPLPNGYPHAQATEDEAAVYAGWYTSPYQYTTTP